MSSHVGRRLSIKWLDEKPKPRWFSGVVKEFSVATSEHLVVYDDGDQRQEDLAKEEAAGTLRWLDKSRSSKVTPRKGASRAAPSSAKGKGKRPAKQPRRASQGQSSSARSRPRKRGRTESDDEWSGADSTSEEEEEDEDEDEDFVEAKAGRASARQRARSSRPTKDGGSEESDYESESEEEDDDEEGEAEEEPTAKKIAGGARSSTSQAAVPAPAAAAEPARIKLPANAKEAAQALVSEYHWGRAGPDAGLKWFEQLPAAKLVSHSATVAAAIETVLSNHMDGDYRIDAEYRVRMIELLKRLPQSKVDKLADSLVGQLHESSNAVRESAVQCILTLSPAVLVPRTPVILQQLGKERARRKRQYELGSLPSNGFTFKEVFASTQEFLDSCYATLAACLVEQLMASVPNVAPSAEALTKLAQVATDDLLKPHAAALAPLVSSDEPDIALPMLALVSIRSTLRFTPGIVKQLGSQVPRIRDKALETLRAQFTCEGFYSVFQPKPLSSAEEACIQLAANRNVAMLVQQYSKHERTSLFECVSWLVSKADASALTPHARTLVGCLGCVSRCDVILKRFAADVLSPYVGLLCAALRARVDVLRYAPYYFAQHRSIFDFLELQQIQPHADALIEILTTPSPPIDIEGKRVACRALTRLDKDVLAQYLPTLLQMLDSTSGAKEPTTSHGVSRPSNSDFALEVMCSLSPEVLAPQIGKLLQCAVGICVRDSSYGQAPLYNRLVKVILATPSSTLAPLATQLTLLFIPERRSEEYLATYADRHADAAAYTNTLYQQRTDLLRMFQTFVSNAAIDSDLSAQVAVEALKVWLWDNNSTRNSNDSCAARARQFLDSLQSDCGHSLLAELLLEHLRCCPYFYVIDRVLEELLRIDGAVLHPHAADLARFLKDMKGKQQEKLWQRLAGRAGSGGLPPEALATQEVVDTCKQLLQSEVCCLPFPSRPRARPQSHR